MRVDKKSLPPEYLQFLVQEPRTGGIFEDKMTQEEFDNIPQNCTPVDSDLSEEERERRSKRGRLYDSDVEDGDLYDHSTDRDDDKKSETVGGAAPKTKKHKKVKKTLKRQKTSKNSEENENSEEEDIWRLTERDKELFRRDRHTIHVDKTNPPEALRDVNLLAMDPMKRYNIIDKIITIYCILIMY